MEKVQYNYRMTLSYTYCSLTPRKEREQGRSGKGLELDQIKAGARTPLPPYNCYYGKK
jgi:hypothetical protein